jgi:hypothetical protein
VISSVRDIRTASMSSCASRYGLSHVVEEDPQRPGATRLRNPCEQPVALLQELGEGRFGASVTPVRSVEVRDGDLVPNNRIDAQGRNHCPLVSSVSFASVSISL